MSLLTIVSVINEDLSTDAATWPIALNSLDLRLYELHQPHEISQHLSPAFQSSFFRPFRKSCAEPVSDQVCEMCSAEDTGAAWMDCKIIYLVWKQRTFWLHTFLTVEMKLYCL